MSALSLPPTAAAGSATRRVPAGPAPERRTGSSPAGAPRRHLQLVDPPASALAPRSRAQAWRRRLGALIVVAFLVVLAVQALVEPAPVPAAIPVAAETVVVEPGQTLWDVAVAHAPQDVTTGEYVRMLTEVNRLPGGQVGAWQVLRLPATP